MGVEDSTEGGDVEELEQPRRGKAFLGCVEGSGRASEHKQRRLKGPLSMLTSLLV